MKSPNMRDFLCRFFPIASRLILLRIELVVVLKGEVPVPPKEVFVPLLAVSVPLFAGALRPIRPKAGQRKLEKLIDFSKRPHAQ